MILEIIFICIIGTLLHFTYELSNHNKIVALFSVVNESIWEHIKMSISAVFICSIFDGLFLGSNPNYFIAKFISLLIILILMPSIFYAYTKITKRAYLFIDIISFFIVIIISQLLFYKLLETKYLGFTFSYIGVIGIFLIFGFYMVVTLSPIKLSMFKDPITNKYGLKGHSHNHQ